MTGREKKATGREVVVPANWQGFYQATHIPAAVRQGGTVRLTGHTGDEADGSFSDRAETQIRRTFENVALTLAEVQMGGSDVVGITSYHVSLQQQSEALLRVAAEFLEDPYPAWTAVGVIEFFEPEAVVEISCGGGAGLRFAGQWVVITSRSRRRVA
jgi:enamine deaminase RidA (YjgF/YER057c/UK114 family)